MSTIDLDSLSLTEAIQLQQDLSAAVKRRFERQRALAFIDVVGSTKYYEAYGDEAGRGLIQRFLGLLRTALPRGEGQIVDTAGDGAFTCFPKAEGAAVSLVELEHLIQQHNPNYSIEHQLTVRVGIHFGPVLTDGQIVSGDSVNMCARIAAQAQPGEIVLSRECLVELSNVHRVRCRHIGPAELKGIAKPVELFRLQWRERERVPKRVRIEESGEILDLPVKDVITFGRLQANDVVLRLTDPEQSKMISRWHFELRRCPEGFRLRPVSDKSTVADGTAVTPEADVLISVESVVKVAGIVTLRFLGEHSEFQSSADETMMGGATLMGGDFGED